MRLLRNGNLGSGQQLGRSLSGPSTKTVSRREGLFSECLSHMILHSLTLQSI